MDYSIFKHLPLFDEVIELLIGDKMVEIIALTFAFFPSCSAFWEVNLGIVGALVPGALMAMLFTETVRHGIPGGIKVALVPLLIDTPFIIAAMILARQIEAMPLLLGLIAMVGTVVLLLLSIQNIRAKPSDFSFEGKSSASSFYKGVAVHILNPNLYIHWFSVATPIFAGATLFNNILFAGGSLITSVCVMFVLVFGVAKARMHFFDHMHIVLRILGVALLLLAGKLFFIGLTFFG